MSLLYTQAKQRLRIQMQTIKRPSCLCIKKHDRFTCLMTKVCLWSVLHQYVLISLIQIMENLTGMVLVCDIFK